MKFKARSRRKPIEYEKNLVKYWKKHKTFEKSVEQRPKSEEYVFYDGPPFITGVPHHGTLLSSVVKDAVLRYWAMKGKRIERVWGWDCHGLPAEVFVENKLGIHDKRDIGTKISLEDYIIACRENMVQTGNLWEETIDRIGRWVDFKGAYKTMDKEYMESVWWAFKQLYDKGKIYEGKKVLLYCTRDATPLSKAEVTMDSGAYQEVTTPSVYVKFPLVGEKRTLLAWTTTPWTLVSNSSVAINKDLTYVDVEVDGEVWIMAESLVDKVLVDERHKPIQFKVLKNYKGEKLLGKKYEPLFEPVKELQVDEAFKIWHADFVTDEDGTGIAHQSPAFGEEDFELALEHGFPWIISNDENGNYTMGEWEGQNVWDVNKEIAKTLHERGKVWKVEYFEHSYPHCHRCGTKLMYRAHPSWFVDVQSMKEDMLSQNNNIYWFPEHIKKGRFHKNIEQAPDWNISRDRFWATPLPVWKGTDKKGNTVVKVMGSYEELKEVSGVELEDYHRPWIDDVKFTIEDVEYTRVENVMDSWFESGSMPFAQFHYPFENVKKFEDSLPADFIAEYIGQVRAWFYVLHAQSVALFGKNSFKNVIVTGTLSGSDGRKMSKSYGNYTDPEVLMDQYSADAYRYLLLSSPLLNGEDFNLVDKDVADVHRKLSMIWNMYDFFTMYADVDGWEWDGKLNDPIPDLKNKLDIWIVSRVHQLAGEVEEHMDRYDLPGATKPMLPFIEDASNWYVRRSRRRFWKSEDDDDKNNAYKTLHYVLVRLAHIMAPVTPFMAEELYIKLTGGESVHLNNWEASGYIDDELITEMKTVREVITQGLSQRAENAIKLRQPLSEVKVSSPNELPEDMLEVIKEELNVKSVQFSKGKSEVAIVTEITAELELEGIARDVVRHIQNARKKAGLNVDDRIKLGIVSDDQKIKAAIKKWNDYIVAETLATELSEEQSFDYQVDEKVAKKTVKIALQKSK